MSLESFIKNNTDHYFRKTKEIIKKNKDITVTYAIFMRRPVLFCPKIALKWFKEVEKKRKTKFKITLCNKEGDWVGAGEPLMYITGPFSKFQTPEHTAYKLQFVFKIFLQFSIFIPPIAAHGKLNFFLNKFIL